MILKKIPTFIFLLLVFIVKAQDEFITIWKPGSTVLPTLNVGAPYQANAQQIWFPGIGDNYDIYWEEVDFPQHNGSLTNVTSTKQVLIDFGTSIKDGNDVKYRVKVTNGSGTFKQIKFGSPQLFVAPEQLIPIWQVNGSADKLLEIEQWGNISWTTMNSAFSLCKLMVLTATDVPKLENVEDASFMFFGTNSFNGAASMQNWDTSRIQNFSFMFSLLFDPAPSTLTDLFNPPYLDSWNISSATNLSYMFGGRTVFNQTLNNWNVSKVTDMSWMFGQCLSFNQRLDNWDTSNLEDMHFMFHMIPVFNQPLNWNTSNVTNMAHIFHGCTTFNQPLENWDTTKVTKIDQILTGASSFNQPLGKWNLASLTEASSALNMTAINCENYSKTLLGWADNPNTANNVPLGVVTGFKYASNVIDKRNILINKGWIIDGDTVGSCLLASSDWKLNKKPLLYPNPAVDDIHIEGLSDIKNYKIYDASGRLVKEGNPNRDIINVSSLPKGNYMIQLIMKEKTISSKFIKN
ncbi:BspA family leucine-rich repeat surface protein [Chryseobacterium sp. MEBOG06]|uniref:BspA family leucine-rich repeat surface protein n=1 Tax=Chryseobacterium sp. MEBOG06 TaxID=2879938 RepID=UPI001F1BA51A|nr:BspA family leucine-rich repeat surface protein [Chryseobacterium sp. MEBOG06]UKB82703.1 BspA family leucine-rich repeat surface protein [Chryseobacterium sp. MEBOG06]